MNEENNVVKPEKKKKKRSFWWLWLLLILIVFAGGVIVGLKLNTMPVPYEIVSRYFPQLAPTQSAEPVMTPAPVDETPAATAAPAPTEAPKPTEAVTPAPTEAPKPVETEEPAAPEESAGPDEAIVEEETTDADELPDSTASVSETAEEPKESMKPVFERKDEADGPEATEDAAAAPTQPIGVDKALKAALDHAGVRKTDAEVSGVYKTIDVDTTVYAVEFTANGMEYEYSINALTGEVEGWRSSRTSAEVDDGYFYPDTPDIEKELFPAINRAKKSR